MTEQELNEYGIYALREVARQTGVKSPTSKKKEQLIKEILEISQGKKEPISQKSKQGRPPKNFGYSFINANSSPTTITFKQHNETAENEEDLNIAGYVEIVNLNTVFLWSKKEIEFNCYLIPAQIANKLNLKTGDLITGIVGSGEEKMWVKEVFSVNSLPINNYSAKRADYYKLEHLKPSKKIEVENKYKNLNLMFGESIYLYGTNNNNNSEMVIDLLNACKTQRKIYLNLSIAEKNKYLLKNIKNIELFVADIMEGTEKSKKIISLAIERAKRLLENGEDVVLAVDDVSTCWSIDEPEHLNVKRVMSSTKNAGKKGSLTLFALMNDDSNLKVFEKLADKRYNILENEIVSR